VTIKVKSRFWKLSPQLNMFLPCTWELHSRASLEEDLKFLPEKLHYESFTILVHKKLQKKILQFCLQN